MNPYESIGVDAVNLVRVDFTSNVDTRDALSMYLWYCCIIATYSSVKYNITNGDRPLAAFTKSALSLLSDAVQYLFTIVFTKVVYSSISTSSKM